MKKLIAIVFCVGALWLATPTASAIPAGGGGGGGGGGYMDCFSCYLQGGYPRGVPRWWTCLQNVNGVGGGCTATLSGCTYTDGCQSLPEDPRIILGVPF